MFLKDAILRSLFELKHFGANLRTLFKELEEENLTRVDFAERRCVGTAGSEGKEGILRRV